MPEAPRPPPVTRALRGPERRRRRDRCPRRAGRPHPRRPGRDRAAGARSRIGGRELQGMAAASGVLRRPLLGIRRSTTRQFCIDAVGLDAPGRPAQRQRPRCAGAGALECAARARGRSWVPASPRPSPARPSSCVRTPRRSTPLVEETIEEICEPAEAGYRCGQSAPLAANPPAAARSASSATSSPASSASASAGCRRWRWHAWSPTGTARNHSSPCRVLE